MKTFIKKLEKITKDLISEKESLLFLGLFSRNDKEDYWDLVISANWIEEGKTREIVKMLLDKLKEAEPEYINYINNIIVLSPVDHFLHHLASAFQQNRIQTKDDGETLIKLFDDFMVEAIVFHEELKQFKIKTITKTRESTRIEEPVF